MTSDRRPNFELHIRPIFRVLDQVHMLRLPPNKRIDLFDYQQVKGRHLEIIDFLQATMPMPPVPVGGPWPKELIDLFVRWTQTGFARLVAATVSGLQLVPDAANRYELSGNVTLPDASATAWFDIVQAQPDAQIYRAVMEHVEGPAPSPVTLSITERIRGPLSVVEVVVLDAAGEHRLAVPTV